MKREVKITEPEKQVAEAIGIALTKWHKGKDKAATSERIINGMKAGAERIGVKLNGSTIRRMIQWLRVENKCPYLCSSTTGGYYVAETIEEMQACCDALRERMANQYMTERALRSQLIAWKNKDQQQIYFPNECN